MYTVSGKLKMYFNKVKLCWKLLTKDTSFVHIDVKDIGENVEISAFGHKLPPKQTIETLEDVLKSLKEEVERREFYATFSEN